MSRSTSADCPPDEVLGQLMDDSLEPGLREQLRRHIATCADCRAVVVQALRHMDSREPTAPTPPPRAGRYLLSRVLGMGGMGVVYAAEDPELGRAVAIKVLRAPHDTTSASRESTTDEGVAGRQRQRLLREGQSLARVVHPNVVSVYDVGQTDGQVFVAMELVEGGTLRDWMKRGGYSFAEAIAMFRAIGQGLAAVHEAGVVHRDFKPENVLLGSDGRPRVTDFGLARYAEEDLDEPNAPRSVPASASLTQTGALIGTPSYMAPEQLARRSVGPPADVFAFAVTLWEALYGKRPFAGESIEALESTIRSRRTHRIDSQARGTPRRVRQILLQALAVEPGDRPPLSELLARLDALTAPSRLRGPLGVALVAGVVLALGSSTLLLQRLLDQRRCQQRPFADAFPPQAREALRERLETIVGTSDAAALIGELADYVASLDATHAASCEQTFVQHTLSHDRFAAQGACLAQQRYRFELTLAELGGIVAPPKPPATLHPIDALPPASVCLKAAPPSRPRTGPEQAREEALVRKLAQATTASSFGRSTHALGLFRQAAELASLEHTPSLLAQAQAGEGAAMVSLGQLSEGQQRLETAIQSALYASDYGTVASASLALIERGDALRLPARRIYELAVLLHWASERGRLDERFRARSHYVVGQQHLHADRLLDAEIELRAGLALAEDARQREQLNRALIDLLKQSGRSTLSTGNADD